MRVNSCQLAIVSDDNRQRGTLTVHLLPTSRNLLPYPLLDLRNDPDRDSSLAPVQILEGAEYRYEFQLTQQGTVTTDRPEVFERDDDAGLTGRLRPGLNTGTIPIAVSVGDQFVGHTALEVRSRKLDYLSQYRWMLRDLAESMAEIIMERFGPSEQTFALSETVEAKTLYQRFAFLKSLIEDDAFVAGLQRVMHRPYASWTTVTEHRKPNQGGRTGSQIARSIARPGPRLFLEMPSEELGRAVWRRRLPRTLEVSREEEYLDNFPNRFVKFALIRWRDQSASVLSALLHEGSSAPVNRGRAEAAKVVETLDELLSAPFFREVGQLDRFVADNPVLLRREGYREVYRAFLQFELASQLSWDGGEDVYGAGQRNVATLYEYWAFMQIAQVISSLCSEPFDFAKLFELQENGLNLGLRRGRAIVLKGSVFRLGRKIGIELWFNRTFSTIGKNALSWSKVMRPDCSIRLTADRFPGGDTEEVWIHFDAKYRVEILPEIFGLAEAVEPANEREQQSSDGDAKRDDLLKMHAYRDAIRRSAGAYVVYPGNSDEHCRQYHELLPGLGAFGLRPTNNGEALGVSSLRTFLDEVITHISSQTTQHERNRFWERISYSQVGLGMKAIQAVPFLDQPPADTKVLLGYVKNRDHKRWIDRTGLYNLRADARRGSVTLTSEELAAPLLLLYSLDSESAWMYHTTANPELKSRDDMLKMGYPRPNGALYYCIPIEPLTRALSRFEFSTLAVRRVLAAKAGGLPKGFPVVVSWLHLARELSPSPKKLPE